MQDDDAMVILEARFGLNPNRHAGVRREDVRARLEGDARKRATLRGMEATGGEPDVVLFDGEPFLVDCAAESPTGRRSLCYDRAAWEDRKANKPEGSAVEIAESMGVEILTEEQYRHLQTLGDFDLRTSSWLLTPASIRERGGAIFGDRRYDTVFTFHNGADSYYASRGFRAALRL